MLSQEASATPKKEKANPFAVKSEVITGFAYACWGRFLIEVSCAKAKESVLVLAFNMHAPAVLCCAGK